MHTNRLKLNSDKTQFIWFGTRQQLNLVRPGPIDLGGGSIELQDTVSDLGMTLDSELTMKEHVKRLSKLCFYHLRQLRVVRKSVTEQACVALVHAFVASRLDYCNSLLYGISDSLVNSLQSILRPAARLVLRKRKFKPITAAMREHCTGFQFANESPTNSALSRINVFIPTHHP